MAQPPVTTDSHELDRAPMRAAGITPGPAQSDHDPNSGKEG